MDTTLIDHGTGELGLKPNNIIQCARADLQLKQRKKMKDADAGALYSFSRKHVNRANGIGMLIALAYYEPTIAATTDKKSTYIVLQGSRFTQGRAPTGIKRGAAVTAPVHRVVEGLRQIERMFTPAALVRAKVVAREQEARFLLEMVADARDLLERNENALEER